MPKKIGFDVEAYVSDFLVNRYPTQEVTMRQIHEWYADHDAGNEEDPPFEIFHVRDALYRLESHGVVERSKGIWGDRSTYWCCTPAAFAANHAPA